MSGELGLTDVDSAGVLGRIRRGVTVPFFSDVELSLSSLALAPITHDAALPDREATLRDMPADLTYAAGTPLAAYLEIYGLASDPDNRSHYRVRYTFAPIRSAFAQMFASPVRSCSSSSGGRRSAPPPNGSSSSRTNFRPAAIGSRYP